MLGQATKAYRMLIPGRIYENRLQAPRGVRIRHHHTDITVKKTQCRVVSGHHQRLAGISG